MAKINYKLLYLIKSFSDAEIKEFKKMLASPLYTKGRNYLPLLKEIISHNRTGHECLTFHELYSKLYPGKKYNGQTLKNRFSELFKLAEDYLVYANLNKNVIEKEKILLQEYLDKNLVKLFDSKYKKTKKYVESLPDNDHKFRDISFLNGVNLSLLNKRKKVDNMFKQYYDRAAYSAGVSLIEIFQHGIEFCTQENDNRRIESNIVREILNNLDIDGLIKSFSNSNSKIYKIVRMYYFLYKAFKNPDDEDSYFESRRIFKENINFFDRLYKNQIYQEMINYCVNRQNSGIKKFQLELFKLFNEKLDQGLYSEFKASMFPTNIFRDYIYIGIAIKKYKWVEDFIKKYSKELPEEIREDEINLSFAKLYFANKHFEKSLLHLNKVKGLNYLHYNDASVLKLCCYFELHRFEDSYFEIDKLKHYLRNHKEIPKVHNEPPLNFVRSYLKILNKKTNPVESDLGFLEKEINQTKSVSKRDWLLEKISNN